MIRALLAGCAVLALLTGLQTWRVERLKSDLTEANIEIAGLREFKRLSIDDAQNQADQCQARVNEARRSSQRIETIIERPVTLDPAGCPVRSVIGSNDLRDALQGK